MRCYLPRVGDVLIKASIALNISSTSTVALSSAYCGSSSSAPVSYKRTIEMSKNITSIKSNELATTHLQLLWNRQIIFGTLVCSTILDKNGDLM